VHASHVLTSVYSRTDSPPVIRNLSPAFHFSAAQLAHACTCTRSGRVHYHLRSIWISLSILASDLHRRHNAHFDLSSQELSPGKQGRPCAQLVPGGDRWAPGTREPVRRTLEANKRTRPAGGRWTARGRWCLCWWCRRKAVVSTRSRRSRITSVRTHTAPSLPSSGRLLFFLQKN
jgi:hypothetical protein